MKFPEPTTKRLVIALAASLPFLLGAAVCQADIDSRYYFAGIGNAQSIYLATNGTATGAACTNSKTPCGTLAAAIDSAAGIMSHKNDVKILAQDTGPFDGGVIQANILGKGKLLNPGTGEQPALYIEGLSIDKPVVIRQAFGQSAAISLKNATFLRLKYVTLQITSAGGDGLSVFEMSKAYIQSSSIDSNAFNVIGTAAIHTGSWGIVQIGTALNLSGAWTYPFQAELGGYLSMDLPTITCGANFSFTQQMINLETSILNTSAALTWVGCPTAGVAISAYGNAAWQRGADDDIPGATYKIASADTIHNYIYTPTLSNCDNGTLLFGSTNYAARVNFTGSASFCTINFGKPAAALTYFNNVPSCTVSGNVSGIYYNSLSTKSISISGAYVDGSSISYVCLPIGGG